MGKREEKLESLGYKIDAVGKPSGLYTSVVKGGDLAFLSGVVPIEGDTLKYSGKIPSEVSIEEATKAAELCAANLLRVFYRDEGSLDRIEKLLKVTGYVNSDPSFTQQHVVMNGASQLLLDVLGEAGNHARSAIGMANLPLGASVEVDLVLKLKS